MSDRLCPMAQGKCRAKQPSPKAICWESVGLEGRDGTVSTMWLGSENAYTNCHYDAYGYNLVAQIYGRKRWLLFPPSDTKYLYATRIPFEESSIFSQVDVKNPDLKLHPKIKLTNVYEVILEPGQILYVPRHWWHYVECLEPAISINTWVELTVDNESRIEEAVTRSLFSSLLSSYVNTEKQVTDDGHKLGAIDALQQEINTQKWINPKEEIWDNSRNTLVLNETLKALGDDSSFTNGDVCPRSEGGHKMEISGISNSSASNKQREKNLEKFAQHFRGKTVLFQETPNKNNKLRKQELRRESSIPDTSAQQPDKNVDVTSVSICLKRKHTDDYVDPPCTAKACNRSLKSELLVKIVSDSNCDSNHATVDTSCKCMKPCLQCPDQDCKENVCQSRIVPPTQSEEISLTAVTAQPFMTWYSLCKHKHGNCNSIRDLTGSVMDNNFMQTSTQILENASGSTPHNFKLGSECSCSYPKVSCYEKEMCKNCKSCCSLIHGDNDGLTHDICEKVISKNTLTFEKFVMCATHPNVIQTIVETIKNNMTID
ncbi:uncharacterized protein LOC132561282 isoform X2 [Ylistrum balloti]|uniref:uncharacterized protein LOC132561282 isoform X2 n=1 Tax=Ylistrum balloti TaxID=509963 RepID=UPI002905A8E5|nr:uncharacterized protein LOC132561282 isoform X2 [Ylistrum balloti]